MPTTIRLLRRLEDGLWLLAAVLLLPCLVLLVIKHPSGAVAQIDNRTPAEVQSAIDSGAQRTITICGQTYVDERGAETAPPSTPDATCP